MNKISFTFILCLLIFAICCNNTTDPTIEEGTQTISIKNSETYEYRTGISGDEEGASIILQAKNFVISDIVRNSETKWEAVYIYKSKPFFSGTEYVEIKLVTGSDGASPSTNVEIVKLRILVN